MELLTAMGFPIDPTSVAATEGTTTGFALPVHGRTKKSVSQQAGNTMHVGMMGTIWLALLFKLPHLGGEDGDADQPSSSPVPLASSDDGGSEAVAASEAASGAETATLKKPAAAQKATSSSNK
eukprot:14063132-Alexandrium_andersonii.AAC.1